MGAGPRLLVPLLTFLVVLASPTSGRQLTPQRFLEDNKDAFSIMYAATSRVGYLGGFLAGLQGSTDGNVTGATYILPLDAGFVAASNRTVGSMIDEINKSNLSALEYWLGQWIVLQLLPTPDALVAAQAVETLSGETLTFRLTKDGRGVVVALQGDSQGAGNILGPAGIPMGQVVTYVLGPLVDGATDFQGTFSKSG